MNTILNQFQDKINGTFSFFDRMIIKGHIRQFFSTSGSGYFLSSLNVLLKDFSSFADDVTNTLVSQVEEFTASQNRPLIYLYSAKDSKEKKALEIMADNPVSEGLICTLSVVEYCQTLQPIKKQDSCGECLKESDEALIIKSIVPAPVMKHSTASPSSVAQVMYQKYVNAMPLYRQEKE